MASYAMVGKKAKITDGIFKGYVGFLYAADFTDKQSKWHSVLIEVDKITSIQIHPQYIDQNIEENDEKQIDIASLLIESEAN
jgi:hypothetical protein